MDASSVVKIVKDFENKVIGLPAASLALIMEGCSPEEIQLLLKMETDVVVDTRHIEKIPAITLVKFSQEYYSQKHSTYKNLRFGQAFLNRFYPDIPEYTDIYYGEDDEKVVSLIIDHFVELERETLLDILWKG